jgi:hypothetical protein
MTHPTHDHVLRFSGSCLLLLLMGCSEAPSRGPDLGSTLTTGDPGGPSSGPGGSGDLPTTGEPVETGTASTTTGTTGTTGTVTSTTGEPGSICGDDIVEGDEQCDDGEANSDHAYCTSQCALNFCGDGHVFIGWELCDEGQANNDVYGSNCGTQCVPTARCGDHIVQADEGEECDLGPDNDGPVGDAQGILCEGSCRSKSLRAFVTSQAFSGNLGGLYGADKKCRDAAAAAGLGEPYRFHAYLSTPDFPANDRFPGPGAEPLPYVLVTGKKLADSHAKLLYQGPLDEGVSVTELGTSLYDELVATNTAPNGTSYSPDQHCLAWTSDDPLLKARVGLTFPSDPDDIPMWVQNGRWISAWTFTCDMPMYHLYCLEI